MRHIHDEFQTMIDVFAATDGGAMLVTFQARYDGLVEEALMGNQDSAQLVEIFKRAAKMVELLSGPIPGEE